MRVPVLVILQRVLIRATRSNPLVLLLTAFALLAFGSVGIYLAEHGDNSDFATAGDSVWWAVVTMSTVGYGDKVPLTPAGRVIASVAMLGGPILLLSLVGSVTVLVYDEWRRTVNGMSEVNSKEHILICGWKPKSRDAINELRLSRTFRNWPITIIDDQIDTKPVEDAKVTFIRGSPTDTSVLERANIRQAGFAIVFAEDATPIADQRTTLAVLAIKDLNPSIRTSAELNDIKNEPHLRRAGCDVVVNTADLTSKLLALSIENSAINGVISELVSRTRGNEVYRIELPSRYSNRPFEEAFEALKRSHDVIVIGVERANESLINPSADFSLRPDDFLLVISEHSPALG